MSPIATRDWDIKRRSAPTAACNIRDLQVRPTDPTLAAGLEHRPARFLLLAVIVAILWPAGCRSRSHARTGPVVGPGLQLPLPPHGPQVGSCGEARQHLAVVIRRANVPCTNVPALTRAPFLCPNREGDRLRARVKAVCPARFINDWAWTATSESSTRGYVREQLGSFGVVAVAVPVGAMAPGQLVSTVVPHLRFVDLASPLTLT
jgi:hypothetical protein